MDCNKSPRQKPPTPSCDVDDVATRFSFSDAEWNIILEEIFLVLPKALRDDAFIRPTSIEELAASANISVSDAERELLDVERLAFGAAYDLANDQEVDLVAGKIDADGAARCLIIVAGASASDARSESGFDLNGTIANLARRLGVKDGDCLTVPTVPFSELKVALNSAALAVVVAQDASRAFSAAMSLRRQGWKNVRYVVPLPCSLS